MFVNTMPRYEILSADAIAVLDRGWKRIVSEIGVSLAFGAHAEVGHGGHFLGAAHTMERFRTCFYRPLLSSTANFERWLKLGGQDAAARAASIWQATLDSYQPPPWTTPSAPNSTTSSPAAAAN